MNDTPLARVIHYYDNISVAILKVLKDSINIGDKIKIGKDNGFEQVVESMQIDHKNIKRAKKGDEFGLKVVQPVEKGTKIYKA